MEPGTRFELIVTSIHSMFSTITTSGSAIAMILRFQGCHTCSSSTTAASILLMCRWSCCRASTFEVTLPFRLKSRPRVV